MNAWSFAINMCIYTDSISFKLGSDICNKIICNNLHKDIKEQFQIQYYYSYNIESRYLDECIAKFIQIYVSTSNSWKMGRFQSKRMKLAERLRVI